MNLWTSIKCPECAQRVRFDPDTLGLDKHRRYLCILREQMCQSGGRPIDPSRLPGWHPKHKCGEYCDGAINSSGQMTLFGRCHRERRRGPPSAVDSLADLGRT